MTLISQEKKPVFFVVGAAKSGTSSLYQYLDAHPDVHMCPHKDVVCYFCRDYGLPVTFDEYYAMLMPEGDYQVSGDVCHVYLSDETAAERLHSFFPTAKIIMILRNPVDKAFSQYNWLTYHGFEYVPSFEEALLEENERLARNINKDARLIQGSVQSYQYVHSSLYSEQIARYRALFSDDQILYLKFEDYSESTEKTMRKVYKFIRVKYNEVEFKRYNKKMMTRSVPFQYLLRKKINKILHPKIIKLLMRLNSKDGKGMKMRPETRKSLLERFRSDIVKTQKYTGLDLSSWMKL